MARPPRDRNPWRTFALVFFGAAAVSAAVFFAGGRDADALGWAVRGTARAAAVCFALAFAAGPLHAWRRSAATRFLRSRRRTLGVSFGAIHFCHLGTLVALDHLEPFIAERSALDLIGGGLAYALIAAMVATSTDAAARRMGPKWRRLHTVGGYYLWLIFTRSYLVRVLDGQWTYAPLLALLLAVLAARLAAPRVSAPAAEV
jgi:sulfoxide reductase heme-binding subunit YedZ